MDSSTSNLASLFQQAQNFQSVQQFSQALGTYQQILIQYPNHRPSIDQLISLQNQFETKAHQSNRRVDQRILSRLLNHLGTVFQHTSLSHIASECFELAHLLNPNQPEIIINLHHQYQNTCDWGLMYLHRRLFKKTYQRQFLPNQKIYELPFNNLIRDNNPTHNLYVAQYWSNQSDPPHAKEGNSNTISTSTPMIAFTTSTARNHARSHLLQYFYSHFNLPHHIIFIGYLDRRYTPKPSPKTISIQSFPQYNPSHIQSSLQSEQVGILTHLDGLSPGNYLSLATHSPTPVQVAWLGYPSTTGSNYINYIITDPIVSPPSHTESYSENFAYLPHSYQANSQKRLLARKFSTATPRLSQPLTLICNNPPYKITPDLFQIWLHTLSQLPQAKLQLFAGNQSAKLNLSQTASKENLQDKLLFLYNLPHLEHLHRISQADLGLDTTLVGGHTNTSDLLSVNVPVITKLGNRFANRVSASLLLAVGLSECITHSLKEYQKTIIHLAKSPTKLLRLKRKLAYNKNRYPLFDSPRLATNLQTAYQIMWRKYTNTKPLSTFYTPDPKPLDRTYS